VTRVAILCCVAVVKLELVFIILATVAQRLYQY